MWEPRPLTTLWAFTACYRDSFTFYFTLLYFFLRPRKPPLLRLILIFRSCLVLVRSVVCDSQCVRAISFCPMGEPAGTDLLASISFLFSIQSVISAADCSLTNDGSVLSLGRASPHEKDSNFKAGTNIWSDRLTDHQSQCDFDFS
jgi:hypothetical protein